MAIKIKTIDLLQKYFSGVVERANHHAKFVNSIIYSLVGIIVLLKDTNSEIEVRGNHEDETGNILWVIIKGTRYAFRYEHSTGEIEIRRNKNNGDIVLTINNTTTTDDIIGVLK